MFFDWWNTGIIPRDLLNNNKFKLFNKWKRKTQSIHFLKCWNFLFSFMFYLFGKYKLSIKSMSLKKYNKWLVTLNKFEFDDRTNESCITKSEHLRLTFLFYGLNNWALFSLISESEYQLIEVNCWCWFSTISLFPYFINKNIWNTWNVTNLQHKNPLINWS